MNPVFPSRRRIRRELNELTRLALPLISGQLAMVGTSVIDTVLAGRHGTDTLAGVAIGAATWNLAFMAIAGTLLAISPSVAQLIGGGQRETIPALLRQAFWLALSMGLIAAFAVWHAAPVLNLVGVQPGVIAQAQQFLHGIAPGAPALALYYGLRGFSEGTGHTLPALIFGLIGLVLLLPLASWLIFGGYGMPSLGAYGCGLATAVVAWIQFGGLLIYVLKRPRFHWLRPLLKLEGPDLKAIGGLLQIGLPIAFALLMEGGMFIAVSWLMGRLGTLPVAAHQVAISVASIAFMLPLGLAMAVTVRVGQARGRGDRQGLRVAGLAALLLCLICQALSFTVMVLAARPIAGWYAPGQPEVIALATQLIALAAIFQLSDGLQAVAAGALRGVKDTRVPMLLTALAYWVIGMPIAWWLGFEQGMGPRGLWIGFIFALSAAALMLLTRAWRLLWSRPQVLGKQRGAST